MHRQQTDKTKPEAVTAIVNVKERAKTIVHIRAASSLKARKNSFENNFVLDMFSPLACTSAIQSNGILIQDLVGSIDLSDSVFKSNGGLSGNNRVGIYPVPNGF